MAETTYCPECGNRLAGATAEGLCPQCLMAVAMGSEIQTPDSTPAPSRAGFEPPSVTSLARLFPHLELLETVGHGGMGAVYKARQTKLDRLVALKIIRPDSSDDPAFAERFNREAKTLARLNHPNIVAIYDFGDVQYEDESGRVRETLYYFIMEYVDGANLRQVIDSGRTEPHQALAIVPQICEALQYAHRGGIVHRDIKPDNILLTSDGIVKIADFGLAKPGTDREFTLTATHQVLGTVRYMAPEQMMASAAVDHRADIYSLGVVFYEMLTGEVPVGAFDPPSQRADIDGRLDPIVMRAMASDPDRRYQSISEISSAVHDIEGVKATAAVPAETPGWSGPSTIIEQGLGALAAGIREAFVPAESDPDDEGRRRVTVSRQLAEHDGLPDVCMVCGRETRRRTEKEFEHVPDSMGNWIGLLVVLFFPAAIALAVATTKKANVECPICPRHRSHWLKLVIYASIGWLLIPGTILPGLAICGPLGGAATAPRIVTCVIMGLAGLAGYLLPVIYMACTRIDAESITDDTITFNHVHAGFARAARQADLAAQST